MSRRVLLSEWQTASIEGIDLTPSDRVLAARLRGREGGRVEIDETRTGIRVSTRSWVGSIRFSNFELRIVPKLAGAQTGLLRLIEITSGLDALRRIESSRSLSVDGDSLVDLIAALFADACEQVVRKGLLADYREELALSNALRGRMLYDRQLRQRFGQLDRLWCRYDEHDENVVENQLLAAALSVALRRVSNAEVKRSVHRLFSVFQEAVTLEGVNLDVARRIEYHRRNEYYRTAHTLAWLLLDGFGLDDVYDAGSMDSFAFLLDMNRLFESFVVKLVRAATDGRDVHLLAQRKHDSVIRWVATGATYSRVIPDLLVRSADGTGSVPIDAKYKTYDEKKVSSSDIYQTFLYALTIGDDIRPRAVVLYPASASKVASTQLAVVARGVPLAQIEALSIPIPAALDEMAGGAGPILPAIRRAVGITDPVHA